MDNPEQYLLQVLHRTQAGLQDSLIPFHGSKMKRLTERLEQAANLKQELQSFAACQRFYESRAFHGVDDGTGDEIGRGFFAGSI